jgi:hypothetical protein
MRVSNTYKLGNSVRVRVVFRDVDDELLDPATVVVMVRGPIGSPAETSYTYGVDVGVARESEGVYTFWVATPDPGTYCYRWKGIDDVTVTNEESFDVDESCFETP